MPAADRALPPVGARPSPFQRLRALGHGGSAVLANAPENAAYGLLAFAPLGAAFGPSAMALALLGAVVANAVASVWGGGSLVSGPRASLSLLTAGLVAALLPLWRSLGPDSPWLVVACVAACVTVAGLLQVLLGALRLGGIVKYTPYPVRIGLTSGIGLLLVATALPVMLGHGFAGTWWHHLEAPRGAASAVGGCALAVAWLAARRATRVPPLLLGLAGGAAVHAVIALGPGSASLGPWIGVPDFPPPVQDGLQRALASAASAPLPLPLRATLDLVSAYALTVAVLCSLDTLLTTSIVDGRLRRSRDANRELVAQGLANIASAIAGAQPASPSVPRSLALVERQPSRRHAVLVYAALMLLLVALLPQALGWLPESALGGVLVAQGLQMISATFWRTPAALSSSGGAGNGLAAYDRGQRRLLWANWAVSVAVALGALLLGLGPAVLIGATLAVLLFVRANMRDVVRRSWTGELRRSLKVRPAAAADTLRREGHRIALLELEGSLFFGTADTLRERLHALAPTVDTAILDLHQVNEIDVTAARILFETAEDWSRAGRKLVFAEWSAGDVRRRAIDAVAGPEGAGALHFEDHADRALERAEDELLASLPFAQAHGERALELREAAIARGLDDDELAVLRAAADAVRFDRGAVLFKVGDPGDALYITLQGEIGLRVPGSERRLVSLAAGVTIGEIAVLAHGTRTVEAVAESEVVALRLPVETFDRWQRERPALAAKLLNNLALHLAERLRVLTGDLAQWVSRAAAGRRLEPSPAFGGGDVERLEQM